LPSINHKDFIQSLDTVLFKGTVPPAQIFSTIVPLKRRGLGPGFHFFKFNFGVQSSKPPNTQIYLINKGLGDGMCVESFFLLAAKTNILKKSAKLLR
jgi:hypothetical protein